MSLRDRVVDFRRVPAADLAPHPRNFRVHPKHQQSALRGLLDEVGFAGAVLARQGSDGKLILIEFSEEHPLLMNAVGMQSNLVNFYVRPGPGDSRPETPPMPDAGAPVGLHPDEPSPILPNLHPDRVYRVMQNNMLMAPVFEHRPSRTDFLLVRSRTGAAPGAAAAAAAAAAPETVLVRRFNKLFVAGQVEPQVQVFQPNDTHFARTAFVRWLETYMAFHYARRLRKREDLTIQWNVAMAMFSLTHDKLVERTLRMVAEPSRLPNDVRRRVWVPLGAGSTREGPAPHRSPAEVTNSRAASDRQDAEEQS